ncbi:MAG TPA: 50S ribosomal protein L22 [Vicinamibacterales bacterium]|jgi:large subunit ribosomal protein L22|nr:50S ribosomal protein L22 [Vicinamibacterales bacterium]
MATARATSRYIRTSAQKAGLVLDQIRGRDVAEALATLRYSRKLIAHDIEKTLRSAVANVEQREDFGGDVDRLYVAACWADQGPSMKRIRPAPMGRAFRVVKRMAHLTVEVGERRPKAGAPAGRPRRAAKTPAKAKAKTEGE